MQILVGAQQEVPDWLDEEAKLTGDYGSGSADAGGGSLLIKGDFVIAFLFALENVTGKVAQS